MTEFIENQSPIEGEVIHPEWMTVTLTDFSAMLELLAWMKPKVFELKGGYTREGKHVFELSYKVENRG